MRKVQVAGSAGALTVTPGNDHVLPCGVTVVGPINWHGPLLTDRVTVATGAAVTLNEFETSAVTAGLVLSVTRSVQLAGGLAVVTVIPPNAHAPVVAFDVVAEFPPRLQLPLATASVRECAAGGVKVPAGSGVIAIPVTV